MFTSILVAIDGSKVSEKALMAALDEARVWKSKVTVLYVVETGLFTSLPMDNTWEVMYSLLEKEGENAISKAIREADAKGIVATTLIRQGHAGNEILKAAQETGADLIVVGSHGRSDVDRILLGSVSSFVVGNSGVAVLVVRP